MKKIISITLTIVLISFIGFKLYSNKKEINANNKVADKGDVTVAVNTSKVKKGTSTNSFSLLGTVAPDQAVDIKAETAGKVEKIYIDLGDELKRGAVVARIDNRLLSIAASNAKQRLDDAKQNYERYKNLFEGGAATQAQYDQFKLSYENAQNQYAEAKRQLDKSVVTAPFSGVITKKSIDEGAYVNIGGSVARLIDVKHLKVELSVAEKDVYNLKKGDQVTISTSVFPGVTYAGEITFISPQGDDAHNYPVEIAFDNKATNTLKAGTYVNVQFSIASGVEVLQIPRSALIGSIQSAKTYLVKDGVAYLKDITVGRDNGEYLEVVNGLQAGDEVVVTGQINLSDKTKVEVIN
ncbi:efflux RND transporter periplasmic adaptor subunit [Limibacter armeniacum]|uniref:efflux RND transporter periplasmic adaptor subunit n=1 Tax=Limibacter armeniacum TaxID=466084 RepID=UPI002FE68364